MENKKLKTFIDKIIQSLMFQSFKRFEELIFSKDDYKNLRDKITSDTQKSNIIIGSDFKTFKKRSYIQFDKIITKGENRNLDWSKISFDGFVFAQEDISLNSNPVSENHIIRGHLGFKFIDRFFTIFGIQIILLNEKYKLNTFELAGLFELEIMDYYIPTDEMYLESLDDDGY